MNKFAMRLASATLIFALIVVGISHYVITDRYEKAYNQLKFLAVEEARSNEKFRAVLEEHAIVKPGELEESHVRPDTG